jgi:hypothetical protein
MSAPPTVIPAPRGPNWQLLIHSLVLLTGAGALMAHLAGIRVSVVVAWPTVLIVGGLALVVVGQLGLLRRRRRSRSQ